MIASILGDAFVDVATHPVTALAAAALIPLLVRALVVDLRNTRPAFPLQRLGPCDWSEHLDDVIVPGLDAFHSDGNDEWMWAPDPGPALYSHPRPPDPVPAHPRLTPRRIPVTVPVAAPVLPAQLWPDLVGPTTQPTPVAPSRTVFTAPVRRVYVPAPATQPMEAARG